MFPNPQHTPAGFPQCPRHQCVALFVSRKLPPPEGTIVLGSCFMLGTAMPETAVHKKRELGFLENEIWLSENFLIPPPAGDFVPTE